MLVIRADLVDEMVAHARRDHPLEACGQLTGPEGSDRAERYIPMTNTDAVSSDYAFDSREQLRVHRESEERGEEPVVVFHSHTRAPRRPLTDTGLPEAYPSEKDIQYMGLQPGVHFVIVALTGPDSGTDLRSFLLDEAGGVVEDEVAVVENYMFAHTGSDDVPDPGARS
ncbi:CysO-cysteine peptidase [Actinomycetospora sp. NBRC 106375]|uniref:M67 family metallopeptidase n=1 Tax=Actinomycetospora sp. NBRC 106375 TaxID=3032207 RepID=UPI0024A232B8|nr:M67 family metallopeptidase [Actinomycetospora sp. NBRC 106375]GLZ47655.1 CysO-cysteine peptidase [Actinomycetospora sp. NBRC 106375]